MEVTLRLLSQGFCQSSVGTSFLSVLVAAAGPIRVWKDGLIGRTGLGRDVEVPSGMSVETLNKFLPLCNYCSAQTHAGVMAVSSTAFYTTRNSQL